ncbi:MAG: DUF4157 domain-containing protein [Cyanobacteria bacterium P01_F01_bin.86]
MSREVTVQTKPTSTGHPLSQGSILQRKYTSCGQHKTVGGTYVKCQSNAQAKAPQALPIIQTKLTVGQPNDKYEKEADRIAEQVMRMPAPETAATVGTQFQPPKIQRMCANCDEKKKLQAKEVPNGVPEVTPAVASRIQSLQGTGQPLFDSTRNFFEPRFGQDFSHVRVHTDDSAQAIGARAYTVGHNIIFGVGQYKPGTVEGNKLLAHELTHVLQQNKGLQHRSQSSSVVQCDFAVPAPNPGAVPVELTEGQIQDAVDYNRRRFSRALEIEQLRDILGISPTPIIIDEAFVRAVVRFQAQYNLTQDGRVGPITASRLSREFREEAAFLGPSGRELRQESRRLDRRSFTISVTNAAHALTSTGSAEYGVRWAVPDPQANGWIIQHIVWDIDKEDCAGNAQPTNNPDGLEFWEGWEVRNGRVFVGSSGTAHSADTFRTVDEGVGTRGTATITGRVTFMPDFNLTLPPWGHTVPEAWSLPTRTTQPPGWSDGFARLHRMRVTWDDCVTPGTNRVTAIP